VDDAISVQFALSGMDRNIGSAVSTHNPKNLDQVKDIASRMAIAPAISVDVVEWTKYHNPQPLKALWK
jgi:hypothetical protein